MNRPTRDDFNKYVRMGMTDREIGIKHGMSRHDVGVQRRYFGIKPGYQYQKNMTAATVRHDSITAGVQHERQEQEECKWSKLLAGQMFESYRMKRIAEKKKPAAQTYVASKSTLSDF